MCPGQEVMEAESYGAGLAPSPDQALLVAQGLTKEFMGFLAVDAVDLRVNAGTIHALIGPNGAGKTTCFNLLTKTLSPTRGRIVFAGQDITALKPQHVARHGLVRSFQISSVFAELSVLENVRLALQQKAGMAYAFWRSERELARFDRRSMELLDSVGLADSAKLAAKDLPYGRKRALEIATTLALEPQLLLLDEPTQGMGHEDVDRVIDLIRRVAVGRTVLMVEHNMKVVAGLCDRITVLARGQVLAEGNYAEVSAHPGVIEAYLGSEVAA